MPLIDFTDAALPGAADAAANPGGPGLTTSARTNQTALAAAGQDTFSGTVVAPQAIGTTGAHVIPWWIALIVAVLVWKFLEERGGDSSLSEIKLGVSNIVKITVCAIIGLTLFKWVFGVYVIPGLSAIVEAA
jgi:hypothetical protein